MRRARRTENEVFSFHMKLRGNTGVQNSFPNQQNALKEKWPQGKYQTIRYGCKTLC